MSWEIRFRVAVFVFVSFFLPVFAMVTVDLFTIGSANPLSSTILFATVSALLYLISDTLSLRSVGITSRPEARRP